ncbi:hypothetical protein J2S43_003422 [Catenuloplanes nepalensis]|uniref:Uncharacterized protein n=1 Tax=Catenuloplanes nepalensis TaxID=587533 RepID=A0ABT9MU26_9ACTN|nr:hypothetical protein [Catenuloplanes nepalensis]MDP9794910.1 hypothetical protein [Catenuloplanes nepalensis]
MATHIQWFWPDDGLWCYDELDDARWSTRHVEVRAHDGTFRAAASLTEVLEARNSGDPRAVQVYEHRYGVVPEAPFPMSTAGSEPSIERISAERFEWLWQQARRRLPPEQAEGGRRRQPR